jgi:hypothetical protein
MIKYIIYVCFFTFYCLSGLWDWFKILSCQASSPACIEYSNFKVNYSLCLSMRHCVWLVSYWDFHTLLLYIIHSKVGGRERVITIVFDKSICLLGKWIKLLITILTSSHITQNSMSHLGRSKFLSLIETNCYLKCVGLIIFVFTTFECNVTHSGVSYF